MIADRDDCGHNAPPEHKLEVYISGQKRRVAKTIKRGPRRRCAVEPGAGHRKSGRRMGRNRLARSLGLATSPHTGRAQDARWIRV